MLITHVDHKGLNHQTLVRRWLFWFRGHSDGCGFLLCSGGSVAAGKLIDGCQHVAYACDYILLQVCPHFTKVFIQLYKQKLVNLLEKVLDTHRDETVFVLCGVALNKG